MINYKFYLTFFLLFNLLIVLKYNEYFTNIFNHPKMLNECFNNTEINNFNKYYKYSKIIYSKNNKGLCYLTPTKFLNEIPIISWNGYYINNFCINKKYRKMGYGKELLTKIINLSKKENKDHLILQIKNTNIPAKKLYYKYGFIDYFKGLDKDNNIQLFLVKYL